MPVPESRATATDVQSAAPADGGRKSSESYPAGSKSASRARNTELRAFWGRLLGSLGVRSTASSGAEGARQLAALCHALLSERAEVSGALIALDLLKSYASLDDPGRAKFFDLLIADFSPDRTRVTRAMESYHAEPTQANLVRLQRAVEPPRRELFRRITFVPEGMAALVRLRRDLLRELELNPEWTGIDADLVDLFRSWFSRAFLEMRRIDWRTPAVVLEKLIEYEAVHQIQGWHDLRRRLQADRRCYGFFHRALPDEPLIFIEVALTSGMGADVQPLLDPDSPVFDAEAADCATFYSITNCQEGLRGVSFGNLLIKQVVEHLRRELPGVKTFATLSPIPGFRTWLAEIAALDTHAALRRAVADLERPDWWTHPTVAAELKRDILPLCAHYLLHATRGKESLDPVARFHLRNGARLERLNWLGNTSLSGLSRSAGLTANYVYDVPALERNQAAYSRDFKVVASGHLRRLAKRSLLVSADGDTPERLRRR